MSAPLFIMAAGRTPDPCEMQFSGNSVKQFKDMPMSGSGQTHTCIGNFQNGQVNIYLYVLAPLTGFS